MKYQTKRFSKKGENGLQMMIKNSIFREVQKFSFEISHCILLLNIYFLKPSFTFQK